MAFFYPRPPLDLFYFLKIPSIFLSSPHETFLHDRPVDCIIGRFQLEGASMSLASLIFGRRKSIAEINATLDHPQKGTGLKRELRLIDLTCLCIAAIVGAGIFSTVGEAAANGGPAISFLFIFTAFVCLLSALCYAEFASRIPVSGGAYSYAYASFGEFFAWVLGWSLICEYAIGNVACAISWSDYFTDFMHGLGVHLPAYICTDYLSAMRGYEEVLSSLAQGLSLDQLSRSLQEAYAAWMSAPQIGGLRLIGDLPAFGINLLITILVYLGITQSKLAGNIMVALKMTIILAVIVIGFFYVTPDNWTPFAPKGLRGVLQGVSAVFFAYIGFDAIATTGDECRNPRRDLPRAMFLALAICTLLYIVITFVLTGMVPYYELNVGDPLAYIFGRHGLHMLTGVVAFCAIIAVASVILVFQIGQPRIWMVMGRDGLLPPAFAKVHPKFKTPGFSTIITGLLVGIPCLFVNLTEVTDLTSIGTLFAFALVCGGVLLLPPASAEDRKTRFLVPYINGKYLVPLVTIAGLIFVGYNHPTEFKNFLMFNIHADQIPYWPLLLIALGLSVAAFRKNLSFIPSLGLLCNLYLMSELGAVNWLRFIGWIMLGLFIYFCYGRRHSVKGKQTA